MASITAPVSTVGTAATAPADAAVAVRRSYVAPAVAAAIGAASAVLATWGIVATQTLHMSL